MAAFILTRYPGVPFYFKLSQLRGRNAARKNMSINLNYSMENNTRDFPAITNRETAQATHII